MFYCPRRDDMARSMAVMSGKGGLTFYFDPEAQIGKTKLEDRWESDRTRDHGFPHCSYCGSLEPKAFLAAVEAGAQVGPTDKGYKVYVDLPEPHPDELRVYTAITHDPRPGDEGWLRVDAKGQELLTKSGWGGTEYRWYKVMPNGPVHHDKFYLQHVAHPSPERSRLYDLVTDGKVNVGYPGYFYSGLLGMRLEYLARHPEDMTDEQRTSLAAFRERNPGVAAP